jgi:DNA-binding transcriptional MerR regulator
MEQITKSFYTIGEVAAMLKEAPSLIRFWEKEFPQLKPHKTDKGTRKYSLKDIELLRLIHHLVKEKGYTLEGAKDVLRNQNKTQDKAEVISKLKDIKAFLETLKERL